MREFSFSRDMERQLPTCVTLSDGRVVDIDADFRTVLRCVRIAEDEEMSGQDKLFLLLRWFFKGAFVPDAWEVFVDFLRGADDGDDGDFSKPVMDMEQDADAIYASFVTDYGMDLVDIPYLHWGKFRMLLCGLSEGTALRRRIALREMDTRGLKGKQRADAERAKRRVRLRGKKMSAEEKALQAEIDDALANGRNPAEAIARLNEMGGGE